MSVKQCEERRRKPRSCGPPLLLLPEYKTADLLMSVHTDRMHSSCCSSARPQTLKGKKKLRGMAYSEFLFSSSCVLCVQVCMFYSAMCLAGWPLSSEAARLRCGSDLLSDLIFVCGDRGIYLGKGTWSGYGARPRGKGIVDQCCRPTGCELQHLEKYCAKPKSQQPITAYPSTTTAAHTTTQTDMTQQFQAVYHKKLLGHLGAPNSPKREAYRKKTQPSVQRKRKGSSSSRRINTENTTSGPPSASWSPLQRVTRFES
ncbi:insulin-like growth factor I [Toxotes jaculatrix]|uniref:insulin-like growth factor I n=1 Tax=Toxotes jaculatrix TaxID=941984 RepID=UPI001B3A8DE1|nr:insulin-like growth factor I [Toxotes jaculatrix]